jgi:hypothetical protein
MAGDFAETQLSREKDLRLVRAQPGAGPEGLRGPAGLPENPPRSRHRGDGRPARPAVRRRRPRVPVLVSACRRSPTGSRASSRRAVEGHRRAARAGRGVSPSPSSAGTRKVVRAVLEGALATAITLSVCRLTGPAGRRRLGDALPPAADARLPDSGWGGARHGYSRRPPGLVPAALAASAARCSDRGAAGDAHRGAGMASGCAGGARVLRLGLFAPIRARGGEERGLEVHET